MKVSRIRIRDYNQFKDFDLDLTYPEGHEKAGKPLEKVCFIGQSGTGKTTLVKFLTNAYNPQWDGWSGKIHEKSIGDRGFLTLESEGKICELSYLRIEFSRSKIRKILLDGTWHYKGQIDGETLKSLNTSVYFFPVEIMPDGANFNNLISKSIKLEEETWTLENDTLQLSVFNPDGVANAWRKIYEKVSEYQHEEANFRIGLTKKAETDDIDIKGEIVKWRLENPNPLAEIGKKCLDPILKEFYLRTKIDVDDVRELNTIQIESITNKKTIPYEGLSTGTRQIIFTALPLYLYQPDQAIILMDEPETSLYPDIQEKIINYYTSFGTDNQFFFATHSPVIASSFEPWEIVELIFDEEGYVVQKPYYDTEKGKHVDNYHTDPRLLRWDAMFMKMFGMEEEGNENYRSGELLRARRMKNKLEKLKKENKQRSSEFQELMEDYLQLSGKLGWDIN